MLARRDRRPETTPVLEATRLQDDLKRAGIMPWGWIVNASLAAAQTYDPLLVRRAEDEIGQIERVRSGLTQRSCRSVLDAALIAAAQAVEHYEMTR